jgi:hypothetical protein
VDPLGAPLSEPEAARCSVSGDPAPCDLIDVAVLARANALLSPPLAQSCIAAQP